MIFHYCYIIVLILTSFYQKIVVFFSGHVYLSFGIFISNTVFSVSIVTVSKVFCDKFVETFLVFSAISFPMLSPVTSSAFWISPSEAGLSVSVADYLALSKFF